MLAEEFADLNPYQFGANNPVMFNDPTGALTNAQFNTIINTLWNSDYGGYWSSSGGGGGDFYKNDGEAFSAGASHLDRFDAWGTNGFASSFESAKNSYYRNGGTDASVRTLNPNITVYGNIRNGMWETRNTVYSGFGGGGYASADDAAKAWASQYAKWSIVNNTEVSSLIYEKKGEFFYTEGRKFTKSSIHDFDPSHSSPGPKMLIPMFAKILKGTSVVAFIHSHGGYDKPTDNIFSTWSFGWSKENSYDIYGAYKDKGIVLNYPNLVMYLSAPNGNLLRRDSENTTLNGFSYSIGSGYYSDPKARR